MNKYTMTQELTYRKPWRQDDRAEACEWHQWLAQNALSGLEYQLTYWPDHILVEFWDLDRGQEFAQELGL